MDRIAGFLAAVESEQPESKMKIKIHSIKISNAFKTLCSKLVETFKRVLRKKQTETANEAFGFGKPKKKDPTDACIEWLMAHNDELARKYNDDDRFVNLQDTSPEGEFIKNLSVDLKTNIAWEQSIPLMSFKITQKNSDKAVLIATLGTSFNNMRDIVSRGYLTIMFDPDVKTIMAGIEKAEAALIYHEIWNIENPDVVEDKNKAVIICDATFSITPKGK